MGGLHISDREQLLRNRTQLTESREDDPLALPGYKKARRVYLAKRDGKELIIPIAMMTDAEIRDKVKRLKQQARSEHAKELLRYLASRKSKSPARVVLAQTL